MSIGFALPGLICLGIFAISYLFILLEEYTHLRKSKPAILGACLIWLIIAGIAPSYNVTHDQLHHALFEGLSEFAALFLFLLVAMTYIAALEERDVFHALRSKLVRSRLSYKQLFWATGIIAFLLSPIADNLTTALILGTVAVTAGAGNVAFIAIACVNIVNAANAGGTFSPFGDITTLMVWQSGRVEFIEFLALFIPSLINFILPASIMHLFIPKGQPLESGETVSMKRGAKRIIILGLLTIATAVGLERLYGLPPFMGMMLGFAALMIFFWSLDRKSEELDIFKSVSAVEWDTLLFFFGVIFSVGGLAFLGYLEMISSTFYQGYGPGPTNIVIGLISSILGNIPLLFGVLQMNPEMDHFQWLLITLTTGVGGSLLSIGSAAGIGLMGVAKGHYTFFSHLKWLPVLLLGYAAAIGAHYALN
jgi:Na+/H+ antiporter NhaD/arsenite permease-like protein